MTDDELSDDEFRGRLLDLAELADAMGNTTERMRLRPSDVGHIARRLLELLPPGDSDTPVTAEWLKAVGFDLTGPDADRPPVWATVRASTGPQQHISVTLRRVKESCGMRVVADDGVEWDLSIGGTVWTVNSPTRGHIRRLALALGIQLTEPT